MGQSRDSHATFEDFWPSVSIPSDEQSCRVGIRILGLLLMMYYPHSCRISIINSGAVDACCSSHGSESQAVSVAKGAGAASVHHLVP